MQFNFDRMCLKDNKNIISIYECFRIDNKLLEL